MAFCKKFMFCMTGYVRGEDDRPVPPVVLEFMLLGSPDTTLDAVEAVADKPCALNGGSEPFVLHPECLTVDVPCRAEGRSFICNPHQAYNPQ